MHIITFLSLKNIFLALAFILVSSAWQASYAIIYGAHGIRYSSSAPVECLANPSRLESGSYFKANACNLTVWGYVPVSGKYKVRLILFGPQKEIAETSYAYFEAGRDIQAQPVTVSGKDVPIKYTSDLATHACYTIADEDGKEWALEVGGGRGCSGYTPLPPTPPSPAISCSINNGGLLSVDFGSLDRALLPTVPETGQAQYKQIPVVCTTSSSVTTVNMSMQASYTPITVSGKQVIKTSSNGVGVTLLYNNQALASGSVKPLTLTMGTNMLTLGFEAVRNPSVNIKDVPAGSFSASAVMILTMQ